MNDRPDCKARRNNDQMVCGSCGLQWDIDDDDPPGCVKQTVTPDKHLTGIYEMLDTERKPK